jgi:glutaminyl-peptide cyclotransferase
MRLFILITFSLLVVSCKTETPSNVPNVNTNAVANKTVSSNNQPADKVPVYTYEIVNTFKHDPQAFTQGLFFHDGFLYEGTGQFGKSELRKVELETGKVVQKVNLAKSSFGEGATILNDKIYQLTWQEGQGFIYDAATFKLLGNFGYAGEGWGLTNDGKNPIMSDGTHILRVVEPETFKTIRTLVVNTENGRPLMKINELEYIKGEIWANVWHSEDIGKPNYIARIDSTSGKLLGWIDLGGISPDDVERDDENTLNGIAYDAAGDRIFVTGKNWKKLFEIKIKPKQ